MTAEADLLRRAATKARGLADAEHIATWSPPVALAVADWLDVTARGIDPDRMSLSQSGPFVQTALAVARAILNEPETR